MVPVRVWWSTISITVTLCQITDESASVYGPKWSTSKHRTHFPHLTNAKSE